MSKLINLVPNSSFEEFDKNKSRRILRVSSRPCGYIIAEGQMESNIHFATLWDVCFPA